MLSPVLPNSDRNFGLTQAYFEANSADFPKQTQNFGNFKQKPNSAFLV